MNKSTLLIVDDDKDVLNALRILLKREFEEVIFVNNPNQLISKVKEFTPHAVLLDMNFNAGIQSGNEGLFWMREIHKTHEHCSVVMLTAYGEVNIAVKALKEGAADFITKPWDNDKLIATLKSAAELNKAKTEVNDLKVHQKNLLANINKTTTGIIGESEQISQVRAIIKKVAKTEANILIYGENGTGKELVAKEIHNQSLQSNDVFMSVDMASISETLFESEMFGHMKGAFTDAIENKTGKFLSAHNGTLFLDEIGNLSLEMQAKVLRAIQNKEVTPLGSNKSIAFNSRIISATNKNLKQLILDKAFREDLFFRINTITIEVPPLRERIGDVETLAKYYLDYYKEKYEKSDLHISLEGYNSLQNHHWPGNVRELKHLIERAVILNNSGKLTPEDFNFPKANIGHAPLHKRMTLDEMEKWTIEKSMHQNNRVMSRVAQELGITRATLYKKIKKYGI